MSGSISYIPISNDAARQYIDARQAFLALRDAQRDARHVRGGMYWHGRSDRLTRTSTYGSEKSLGLRSPETEKIYADFMARKTELTQRVDDFKIQLRRHERVNKALYVGRVDPTVIALLTRLESAELAEYFHVVGTHALYAYETVAGVRFDANVTATRDIDLLWDVRKRMSFWTQMERLDSSFLALLKKVDSSFRIRPIRHVRQRYTAVNAGGFELDILRRMREGDDPHPIKISERTKGEQAVDQGTALEELSVVQAARADVFLNTPSFEAVIVDRNGRMAMMRTIQPKVFVEFKRWMSGLPDREPIKRQRDAAQANAVQALLDEERLM
jgi:hypothetical protein